MGYVAARVGWFSEAAEKGVSAFVFNFAVPFMLLRTVSSTDLPESIPWALFGSYYIPAFSVYGMGMFLARSVFGRDAMGTILTGMGCAFSNTVLLGLPLILLAYGEEQALPFFLILSVHGILLFTGTTILLEAARGTSQDPLYLLKQIAIGMIKNPILLGLAMGLGLNLSGLSLVGPIDQIAATMTGAVLPCALFALGCSLRRYGIAGRLTQSLTLTALKLILFPLGVFVLGTFVFDLDPIWVQVAVITAAQPSGVMVFVFAQRYGTAYALATTSIFLSTLGSVVTVGLILWLFRSGYTTF